MTKARRNAKTRNLEFTISKKDIEIPNCCPVFGTTWGEQEYAPSLDRIDNSKGYIPGNILVVSWRANRIKNDSTLDELKAIVECYSNLPPMEQLELL